MFEYTNVESIQYRNYEETFSVFELLEENFFK